MRLALGFAGSAFLAAPSWSQDCGTTAPGFSLPGADGAVSCSIVWDDGTGAALYLGGPFRSIGGVAASAIVKFDGTSWNSLGAGLVHSGIPSSTSVASLAVFQGQLYVSGSFTHAGGVATGSLARWNGSNWSALASGPVNGAAHALAVFQSRLYIGGDGFALPGIAGNPRIAAYDGSSWSTLGVAFHNGSVHALQTWNDGAGEKLYVGGHMVHVNGPFGPIVNGIASWDGSSWGTLSTGVQGSGGEDWDVVALAVHDDGTSSALYIGGVFLSAGGVPAVSVARWNGTSWSALGSGITGIVHTLASIPDATGARLFAGGQFSNAGGLPATNVARWSGSSWSALGSGVDNGVRTLATFQNEIVAGGYFRHAGSVDALRIAGWNGLTWRALEDGHGVITTGQVLVTYDAGAGGELYLGLQQNVLLPTGDHRFLRWTGSSWTGVGVGILQGEVRDALVFDDGLGAQLYATGTFTSAGGVAANGFARWNGSAWSALPGQPLYGAQRLAIHDGGGGSALHAAPVYLNSGVPAGFYVARWTGTGWVALGGAIDDASEIKDLASFDDGSGPALFACGSFSSLGTVAVPGLAKWNGTSWVSIGTPSLPVNALFSFDDGTGARLYAGGYFQSIGGVAASCVARWNGATWSPVGTGLGAFPQRVDSFVAWDAGTGPALVATGDVVSNGQRGLARWNGGAWLPIADFVPTATPIFDLGVALAVLDDGASAGPDLWVGGSFLSAGGVISNNITRIEGCANSGAVICAGDGSAAPCPCANEAPAGSGDGCRSSIGSGGRLRTSGLAHVSSDNLTLSASQLPNSSGLFLQGSSALNGGQGASFGDGLRCAGGTVLRLATRALAGGSASLPDATLPTPLSQLGGVSPGSVRIYQVHYRNSAAFCTSDTFNLTNAVRVVWSS